jgi:hypothetical protein
MGFFQYWLFVPVGFLDVFLHAIFVLYEERREKLFRVHTPYRAVKGILMGRFLRRLECAGVLTLPSGLAPETVASSMKEWESFVLRSAKTAPERTVPGRTADTESRQPSNVVGDASRSVGGCSRPVNTTSVNRRAKLPLPGSSCS